MPMREDWNRGKFIKRKPKREPTGEVKTCACGREFRAHNSLHKRCPTCQANVRVEQDLEYILSVDYV